MPDDIAAALLEPARRVPVVGTWDLCVVGGSCTGVFAAVRAARLGARVCLIEGHGFFGGVATAGLVNIWHSTLDTELRQTVIAGLTAEVVGRLRQRGGVVEERPTRDRHYVLSAPELVLTLDGLVTEAGVRPFLHTRFVAPWTVDGRLDAVIIEDKTGRRAVRAAAFIDATGDGDLVHRLGLPTRVLPDLQPPTVCAILRGLGELGRRNPAFNLGQTVFDPRLPGALPRGFLWSAKVVGSADETMVAGTRVNGANCADADELTRAELEGRRQVRRICDLVRTHVPGAADLVSLAQLPACIGIRETRHAECLHQLTETELLGGTRFPDAIANGTYRVDVHHSDRPGLTFRNLDGTERYVDADGRWVTGRWREATTENPTFYQIPYRSLVPRGADRVLAAGRLVDADRGAYGAVRVMVNTNQTGEAAGVAACLALQHGVGVAQVDPGELRQSLAAGGSAIL